MSGEALFRKKGKVGNIKDGGRTLTFYIEIEIRKGRGKNWETLKEEDFLELSICGEVRRLKRLERFGQINDCLEKELEKGNIYNCDTKALKELLRIWRRYHLNGLRAGTKRQEEALRKAGIKGDNYSYEKAVEYLKKVSLYEDNGYKYGTAWLFEPLPGEVVKKVKELAEKLFNKEIKS